MVLGCRYAVNANSSDNVVPSLYISNILYQIGGAASSLPGKCMTFPVYPFRPCLLLLEDFYYTKLRIMDTLTTTDTNGRGTNGMVIEGVSML